MTATDTLRCFTVLPEMHVKVLLHGTLALCRVGKSETTLLTLYGHTAIEEMHDVRAMSARKVSPRNIHTKNTLPADICARESHILGQNSSLISTRVIHLGFTRRLNITGLTVDVILCVGRGTGASRRRCSRYYPSLN